MKQFILCAAAFTAITMVGCQQQPPVIIEQQPARPPVVIERPIVGCNYYNHCGRYSCPVCRANSWYVCTQIGRAHV